MKINDEPREFDAMSDNNSFPFWNTDWVEAQRKYMEAFSALAGNATDSKDAAGSNGDDMNPWSKALECWWQSVAQAVPAEDRDLYSNLFDQTQAFNFATAQLSHFMQGLAEIGQSADDWQDKLEKHFEEMKNYITRTHGDAGQMFSGMFGALQLPMDNLQRTFSSGSFFPGDFLQGFKPTDLEQVTDKFLSVPGLGYTRESQEQIQEGLRLLASYQRTAHEYQLEMNKIAVKALELMKQRILKMAANGEQMNSLREVYDLWVECNEAAYAEYVFTEEYSELYGRLTNDLMALKRHGQRFIDEMASAMGMPTRKGMATVQKRQQQLKRELISSKSRIEALEEKLEEFDELERKVEKMQTSQTNSSSKSTKKKAGKKKTNKKKTGKKKTGKKKTSSKKKAG